MTVAVSYFCQLSSSVSAQTTYTVTPNIKGDTFTPDVIMWEVLCDKTARLVCASWVKKKKCAK